MAVSMDTSALRSFATWARASLTREVNARITAVLAPAAHERIEQPQALAELEKEITNAGGGAKGQAAVADKVAYTWFNRLIALRFMDANHYTNTGVVSPPTGTTVGQPEVLADAKRGVYDPDVISQATRTTVTALLDGSRKSPDPQGEAYALLLADHCRYWNKAMPFMFERQGDYTELLIPANLLADDSVLNRALKVLTQDACQDVEVIGWLYQFYISERKDEVFAGFKKGKKAGAQEIPAATQLFTPHWIVRYLVENSLGRLWLLNRPTSRLSEQMDYYIAPIDEETDYLKITTPEELKVIDPACGSGHMLTYAFDLLYAIYEEEGYAPSDIPSLILTHNLHGTEIDPRAGALAAFALTMKARAKQRTFFNRRVTPRICVIQPITFTPEELKYLHTQDEGREQQHAYWQQFQHADILGALIQPDPELTKKLAAHLDTLNDNGDLFRTDTHKRAKQVIEQAQYLLPRYSVAVANPPYMGSRNMSSVLVEYVRRQYRPARADLFSMFISRCLTLTVPHGHIAMVTMHGWMFLPSFGDIRKSIVSDHRITSMAHLGTRAFDSIGGEVVSTTAFVLETAGDPTRAGDFFRLTDVSGEAGKSYLLKMHSRSHPDSTIRWRVKQQTFNQVPGAPIAYWANAAELELFSKNRAVSDMSDVRAGMATGNNDYFVRHWFEVEYKRLKLDAHSATEVWKVPTHKWVIFNKGGDARRWYGHLDYVLAYDRNSYEMLKESGNRCPSEEFYFRECLTWSDVTSGPFAVRYMPPGSVLSTVGNSIYKNGTSLSEICCALASSVVAGMLPLLNPTLHANPGDVARLPVPHKGDGTVFEEATRIARDDWHSVESSWGFTRPDWIRDGTTKLSNLYRTADREWASIVCRLAQLEAENDWRQRRAFGLKADLTPEHVGPEHLESVTLHRNFYRSGKWQSAEADRTRSMELVSYSVGCMFGRYSLDKPGLILADHGATLQDYLDQVPSPTFTPNADNVIPIVNGDWFEDDIVQRFRQFLRAAFGEEHFEENLRFVTEALGVQNIRDYFVKSFYKDHVQRYKKRPIYWLFSSPKGSFNALIYLHRYTPTTASTVLNEYLREFQAKLRASLEHAQRANNAREADRLRKILLELDEYEHDVLYPLASRNIDIDLDDGVKTNYPKLGAALKKIPGLEAKE